MRLFRTASGYIVEAGNQFYSFSPDRWNASAWDALLVRDDLAAYLNDAVRGQSGAAEIGADLLPPIGTQEVWAAGVTYFRSRDARMEEAKSAGGGDFYQRVYDAQRPELFFKSTPHRVVGPGALVAIRKDATWSVPEPELTLLVTPSGKITGYTIGNDMSSRDIEGENPLYLPQAKVYDRACALGPGILVSDAPLPRSTEIRLQIVREGDGVFDGYTTLESLKRDPKELVEYLYRCSSFPTGCFLLTGTGIVPPDSFSLQPGDEIRISIEGIGTLTNRVG